ncbi:Alg9 family protein mannosyltransferase [Hymenobacter roseosalivarius DSM 11622]|uniref:Alg9 family protein mannosyltransferase n=1 Tax=Hymenobacter roseosalivarius DSM 11622 TaxID=645990 RepID=A0A1W1W3P5_9BACT|nr:glycosyltransferase family 39 protein [Hymenobacter roseosalivarius]SMC00239.1 Alg9 family protein mannosyltransferase [Hymenobacter roseosalivarius DSM 11622]
MPDLLPVLPPTAEQAPTRREYLPPLRTILLLALGLRILAAFFSKGYAFHDDHFDVITIAQDWVYGLTTWLHRHVPPRHSLAYTGLHYGLFAALDAVGFTNPDAKMTIVRLLHGLYSLLVVYFGYKITEDLAGETYARRTGLLLAVLWFMPFMSVRNLVEMVCIPPYLGGFYVLVHHRNRLQARHFLLAGALFGVAFLFRYHTALFLMGASLVLLARQQWKALAWLTLGFVGVAGLVQGTIDAALYDYPMQSLVSYFLFNAEGAYQYSTGPVYRFALTVLGFLVPPISAFLVFGYARTRRLAPLLFWGGVLFFVAHSLFPNKQERFILPLFPLLIVLGVIGWERYVAGAAFWQRHPRLLANSWRFFWVLNGIVAFALALTYSKKSRVEPMVYLSQKTDLRGLVLDFGPHGTKMPPVFYLGRMGAEASAFIPDSSGVWARYQQQRPLPADFVMTYALNDKTPLRRLISQMNYTQRRPTYLLLVGEQEIDRRLNRLRLLFPNLKLEHTITPSPYDQVLHALNPRVHKDEHVRIYQILK